MTGSWSSYFITISKLSRKEITNALPSRAVRRGRLGLRRPGQSPPRNITSGFAPPIAASQPRLLRARGRRDDGALVRPPPACRGSTIRLRDLTWEMLMLQAAAPSCSRRYAQYLQF